MCADYWIRLELIEPAFEIIIVAKREYLKTLRFPKISKQSILDVNKIISYVEENLSSNEVKKNNNVKDKNY